MALVTGKGDASAAISLDRTGLSGFLQVVLTGSEHGSVKPQRLLDLSVQWGVEPANLAYVGDTAQDVMEARSVNVVPLAAGWAQTADIVALEQAGPSALFRTTGEMLSWVRSETNFRGQ